MSATFTGVIAIDGPSGSGKSSVSRAVAQRLGLRYLDTGAMYRAVTFGAMMAGIDVEDQGAVEQYARRMELFVPTDPQRQVIVLEGRDITNDIRTSAVSLTVSAIATNLAVRRELITRQQQIVAAGRAIVLEGRDTTTVVAPDADVRILITADEDSRIARRTAELHAEVSSTTMAQTSSQIADRDRRDSTVASFQTAAEGVITLDTSQLDLEQTIEAVLQIVRDRA